MSAIDIGFLTQIENHLERFKARKINDAQLCDASMRVCSDYVHQLLLGTTARASVAKTAFTQSVRLKKGVSVLSTGQEFEQEILRFLEQVHAAAGFPCGSGGGGLLRRLFGGGGAARPASQGILFAKVQKVMVEFASGVHGRKVAEKILSLGRDHLLDSVTNNKQVIGEIESLARKHGLVFRVGDNQLSTTGVDYTSRMKSWLEKLVKQTVMV